MRDIKSLKGLPSSGEGSAFILVTGEGGDGYVVWRVDSCGEGGATGQALSTPSSSSGAFMPTDVKKGLLR